MSASLASVPSLPAFNRALSFCSVRWNEYAGEAGGYVAQSICGQYEAIAEPLRNGWRFWLVDVNDPENALCMEDVCAS